MKTLKPVNSHRVNQGKKLLGLILISGVFGISFLGCSQETPTPEASKPTGNVTANQGSSSPKPGATTTTTTVKPGSTTSTTTTTTTVKPGSTTTTVKASPTTATPKPSPTTTVKASPTTTTTTPKPSPTTATPKPSPTTAIPQANQSPQSDLPQPNPKGDYSRTSHKFWQVIDPSGKGVSCRMGKSTIEQIQTPGNSVVLDIGSWPVIGNFKQGQTFEINLGPAGFGTLSDTKKEPWIFVEKSSVQGAPVKCFVRANSSSVKPISPK